MILIFGGTTEGRYAVQTVDEAGKEFYYSTRGDDQQIASVHGLRLCGVMDYGDILAFCKEHGIRLLIDAAHPFAVNVHHNIMQASQALGIPSIRYERRYPKRGNDIVWCHDYDDAIVQLKRRNISHLLALTGVQTISKLSVYWKNNECWFRILNKPESYQLATSQGFPSNKLVIYKENNTLSLLRQIRPQAILTKESGLSGGFEEKIAAAKEAGTPIFAVERPRIPEGFIIVNGIHGLRKSIEQCLPDYYPLKTGYTTGACAAAAAKASLSILLHRENNDILKMPSNPITLRLPSGEDFPIKIYHAEIGSDYVTCTVIKDAGDDPDITNGIEINARVAIVRSNSQNCHIIIKGGEGVGIVTLPGLGLNVGDPAINVTPQKMICENLRLVLSDNNIKNIGVEVLISVPQGQVIAEKTFNPRLGVKGGISIIGTSGIVRPFSTEAFVSSIRKEMSVAVASGTSRIVINSGAKSENTLRKIYSDLPDQSFVHYGNFIGETIKIAASFGVQSLTLGIMMGKAVKLAEGHLDTHSKKAVMNKPFIVDMAHKARCSEQSVERIKNMTLARELWNILLEEEMHRFADILKSYCHRYCDPLLPDGTIEIRLIHE